MIATEPRPWRRYVAIGDSFTEGMSDADPDAPDRYVGWADRLATLLAGHAPGFAYANTAIRGRLLADVVGPQLDRALALEPDLVSLVGGGNDLLRPGTDVDALSARLEEAVARVRATGADVLLATAADMAGAPVIRRIRGRAGIWNALLWGIASRHGCHVLDMWGQAYLQDWRMWATDRLHLSSDGHARVAIAAYHALGYRTEDESWRRPLDPLPAPPRLVAARDNARWAREYAAPWVGRRLRGRSSGDLVLAKRPDAAPWPAPRTGTDRTSPDGTGRPT